VLSPETNTTSSSPPAPTPLVLSGDAFVCNQAGDSGNVLTLFPGKRQDSGTDRYTLDKCMAVEGNSGLLDHEVRYPGLMVKAAVHFIKKWKKSLPTPSLEQQ